MDVEYTRRLRNVLLVYVRFRIAYEYFGEVMTFYATYLTNKYHIPFASFIEVK